MNGKEVKSKVFARKKMRQRSRHHALRSWHHFAVGVLSLNLKKSVLGFFILAVQGIVSLSD